jgi:hypothetical protein
VDFTPSVCVVGLPEYVVFCSHYGHSPPAGSGGAAPISTVLSRGRVELNLEESHPLIGQRKLRGRVTLRDVERSDVVLVVFRKDNPIFEYLGWEQDEQAPGRTICAEAVRDGHREIFVAFVGSEEDNSGTIELGHFEVAVNTRATLQLTANDFALVSGELLDTDGRILGIRGAGSAFEKTFEPARLRNELAQNYPNPFNPTTTIAYSVANATDVQLVIYDVTGARVRTLVNGPREANNHKVVWDGKNDQGDPVSSGVYFYVLRTTEFRATKKLVILR